MFANFIGYVVIYQEIYMSSALLFQDIFRERSYIVA